MFPQYLLISGFQSFFGFADHHWSENWCSKAAVGSQFGDCQDVSGDWHQYLDQCLMIISQNINYVENTSTLRMVKCLELIICMVYVIVVNFGSFLEHFVASFS